MPNVLQAGFYKRKSIRGLEKFTLRQKFGNHTIAFLDYQINDKREFLLPPENTPVTVKWGVSPVGTRTFYGYVNHQEIETDERGTAFTRLVCVGTSKVMNSVNALSWERTTRSGIARSFAEVHNLRSVIHKHPFVLDDWASGTRSDFIALRELADEIGYRVWVDGPTLWFLDPSILLRTASSWDTPVVAPHQIRNVEVMGGSWIPGDIKATRKRVQYGLDYITNQFFEVGSSGDPLHPIEVVPKTVTTVEEASQLEDADARKRSENYVIKSLIDGNARLHPGALVRFPSGRVNSDQAGLWMVNEAVHEITSREFTTWVSGSRGMNQAPLVRATSTLRETPGLSHAMIRNGLTWEAALQEHVHV